MKSESFKYPKNPYISTYMILKGQVFNMNLGNNRFNKAFIFFFFRFFSSSRNVKVTNIQQTNNISEKICLLDTGWNDMGLSLQNTFFEKASLLPLFEHVKHLPAYLRSVAQW